MQLNGHGARDGRRRASPGGGWPPAPRPPRRLRAWLEDPGSITLRMREACPGGFSLRLLGQHKARPFSAEARVLRLRSRRFALIRQVLLCCRGVPWVFARSVLPLSSLKGGRRRIATLGSRPLGDLLFACSDLERGTVRVAPIDDAPALRSACARYLEAEPDGAWLRQSLFVFDNAPLLVNEVFLAAIDHG